MRRMNEKKCNTNTNLNLWDSDFYSFGAFMSSLLSKYDLGADTHTYLNVLSGPVNNNYEDHVKEIYISNDIILFQMKNGKEIHFSPSSFVSEVYYKSEKIICIHIICSMKCYSLSIHLTQE